MRFPCLPLALIALCIGGCFDFDAAYFRYCAEAKCNEDSGLSFSGGGGGVGGGGEVGGGSGAGGGGEGGGGSGGGTGERCLLPWGGTSIQSGATITAFSAPLAIKPTCSISLSEETYLVNGIPVHKVFLESNLCTREVRTCHNGVLDGTFTRKDCLGCSFSLDNSSLRQSICIDKGIDGPTSGIAYMANNQVVVQMSAGDNMTNQIETSKSNPHTLRFVVSSGSGTTDCQAIFSMP